MIDLNKAQESKNGIAVYFDNNGDVVEGPIFTGGPDKPVGLDLPVNTCYTQTTSTGILTWRKFGANTTDWVISENSFRTEERTEDVYIPPNELLLMPCLEYSGNLIIDGEAYFI